MLFRPACCFQTRGSCLWQLPEIPGCLRAERTSHAVACPCSYKRTWRRCRHMHEAVDACRSKSMHAGTCWCMPAHSGLRWCMQAHSCQHASCMHACLSSVYLLPHAISKLSPAWPRLFLFLRVQAHCRAGCCGQCDHSFYFRVVIPPGKEPEPSTNSSSLH